MPLAANPLLQTPAAAASKAAAANASQPAVEPNKTGGAPFSKVYAKASQDTASNAADKVAKPSRDKGADAPARPDVRNDKSAGKPANVADSGKPLPGGKRADDARDDQDASTTSASDDVASTDPSALTPVAPTTPLTPPVAEVPVDAVAPPPEVQAPQLAAAATAAAVQPQPVADDTFDPEADPLDDLPAVRLAMEQGGHVSASSQAPTKSTSADTTAPAAQTQGQASGMALLIEPKTDSQTTGEGSEKAFKGLVDDGLKDLKSASSDTRVDDFANRLAALTQAAVPKTANALPVNQPLAMHQNGWSEEVVNRVMYLSSANLKSADIQLEPAELGRLDIRVNIAADQPAQVNFMSGHAGVREALEGQMHRLREMFAQQGMGQVDVNVSDQSRNWQGQGQEQQGQHRANGTGNGGRADGTVEDDLSVAAVEAAAPSVILGSSAVDYYA
ncbi:flagellar hook-length control protein FliK [Pseudomonas lundensis]|uniref:flagellar hook-length control protein FliK n=1 Tax=Pseudomonas lundensis TaxID=86185 RepID=UPI00147336C5|nr:flagellar hook-length control protein FliK [Pseudomonas lundensis]NNA01603.1 flagellar hook-length control protein FliK [Pseudomonas lundensis]